MIQGRSSTYSTPPAPPPSAAPPRGPQGNSARSESGAGQSRGHGEADPPWVQAACLHGHAHCKGDNSSAHSRPPVASPSPCGSVAARVRTWNWGQGLGSPLPEEGVGGASADRQLAGPGHSVEVRGRGSGATWQEAGERGAEAKTPRAKPARPPPPKRVS